MYTAPDGKDYASKRAYIIGRDGGACLNCGSTKRLTFDHVVPRIQGGSNRPRNLQTLCSSCNVDKGHKTIDYRAEEHQHIEALNTDRKRRRRLRAQRVQRRAEAKIKAIPARKRAVCDRNIRGGVGQRVYCAHCQAGSFCRLEAFWNDYRVRCGMCRTKGPRRTDIKNAVWAWNDLTFDEVYGAA